MPVSLAELSSQTGNELIVSVLYLASVLSEVFFFRFFFLTFVGFNVWGDAGGGAVPGTGGGGDSRQAGIAFDRNSLFAELAFESPPFDGGSSGDLRRGDITV